MDDYARRTELNDVIRRVKELETQVMQHDDALTKLQLERNG
jgi:hypothetical protein